MQKKRRHALYYITVILFVVYLLFLVWVILFKLGFSLKDLEATRAYNFIPFRYEDAHNIRFHFSEVIDNILIFIPAGIYLSLLFKKMPFWGKVALVFAASLTLECSQYILAVGRFDITDLITNTVGGLAGVGIHIHDKEVTEKILAVLVNIVTVLLIGGILLILSLN